MVALSMISGRSGKFGEGSGKDQPAINRRTTSALPTTIKYLAMGTAGSSRELSNRGRPWQRCLTTLMLSENSIRGATPPKRAFTGEDAAATRGNLLHDFLDVLSTAVQNDHDVRDNACNRCCDHSCHNMHPTAGLSLYRNARTWTRLR